MQKYLLIIVTLLFLGCTSESVPVQPDPSIRADATPLVTEEVIEEPEIKELTCPQGKSLFQFKDSSFKFCYDNEWGDVNVLEVNGGDENQVFWIRFEENVTEIWVEIPEFIGWYESEGRHDILGGGYNRFCFTATCLDLELSEEKIKEQLLEQYIFNDPSSEVDNVTKITVSNAPGVEFRLKQSIPEMDWEVDVSKIFVPSAFSGHHLTMSSAFSERAELAELLEWMRF